MVRTLNLIKNAGFTSAIIAGGAIRDLYFDVPMTDVDIFVGDPRLSGEPTNTDFDTTDFWKEVFQLKTTTNGHYSYDRVAVRFDDYGGEDASKISLIVDVIKGFTLYQIIMTRIPPVEHVNKYFNIGLCKAHCDGNRIQYTSDFMNDMKKKQFSIVGQDMSPKEMEHTITHHIPKLQVKFPGYKTVVAPHNVAVYSKVINK